MRVLRITAAALCLFGSVAALAHTHLVRSNPADDATLGTAPAEVVLVFAEPVTLATAKVESSEGTKIALTPPPDTGAELHVKLPPLTPGRYQVSWRAASADGHVMTGHIAFTISGPGHP